MAYQTQVLGKVSEMTAAMALISNGWLVAEPVIDEVFDLVAKDPVNGEWKTFQVKSMKIRTDRRNEFVIMGRKANGENYQPSEVDYMLGVDGDTVYMTECTGLSEYWASETTAAKRWIELTAENNEAEAVV